MSNSNCAKFQFYMCHVKDTMKGNIFNLHILQSSMLGTFPHEEISSQEQLAIDHTSSLLEDLQKQYLSQKP